MRPALRRFVLFALLGVILPAAVVAGLGYVSLRQWERSAEALFHEQARELASMAAEKVEMVLRRVEDNLLAQLEAALGASDDGRGALERLLARTPLVEAVYLLGVDGRPRYPPPPWPTPLLEALTAERARRVPTPGGRRHLVVADRLVLAATLRGPGGAPVVAAVVPRAEALRRDIFEAALGGLDAPTVAVVFDHRGVPVWSRAELARAEPVASVAFREGLPDWRLALYQPAGSSPQASVRRQVTLFTAAFGVLLVVIAGGLVATFRLVRREAEMARLKSDFVANVSHDLKTPLSVIRMFGETLEMGRLTDEAARQEYYRVITRESERLSRLIDNVLDFSRIEGGRRTYTIVPTPVEPLIRDTLESFGYPLTQQGFTVDVGIAKDLPDVPMDADAVGQALANLVDNAIKYSGERRHLGIEAQLRNGALALSVADHGVGISREEQGPIFEKFYRAGRSETQGRRGSGVGLALVKHVAEAHGGRVTVESRPGEGSRFTLWLPLAGQA